MHVYVGANWWRGIWIRSDRPGAVVDVICFPKFLTHRKPEGSFSWHHNPVLGLASWSWWPKVIVYRDYCRKSDFNLAAFINLKREWVEGGGVEKMLCYNKGKSIASLRVMKQKFIKQTWLYYKKPSWVPFYISVVLFFEVGDLTNVTLHLESSELLRQLETLMGESGVSKN